MGAKASLHMDGIKSFDVAQSDENERREKDKNWYDREQDYKGAPNHYDWYRRHLNFEIVNGKIVPQLSQAIPAHERLKNRLEELGFRSYKATAENTPNICMDFLIGGDQGRLREMAFGNQTVNFDQPDEKNSQVKRLKDIEHWALDSYRWACKRYGEENVIAFNVHLDETTPHIHMQVVPVGWVQKRGRLKSGEDRKMVKAVSFAAVVGKNPKELSSYKREMHTDYHLQVGWKYGLERGTFFEDLTPEEQALRMHLPKHLFVLKEKILEEVKESKKELENIKAQKNKAGEELDGINAKIKQAEKKLKGLTTMLRNLEEQKEAIEIDIAALEEERDNGNQEAAKKIDELAERLDQLNAKILERNEQISSAKEQLSELAIKKHNVQNEYDDLMRQYNKVVDKKVQIDSELEEADRELQRKRQGIEKVDKTGEIARYKRYIEGRQRIIFRHWPAAEAATHAIYERVNSRTATQFSPRQAMLVEQAISTSGVTRQEAAQDLCDLAQKDFDDNGTWPAWVDAAFTEVMQIAGQVHPLTPFLQQQSASSGGGSSYINDLTGWDGKKRR